MSEYFCENPQIIVNGFVKAGIATAFDGSMECGPKEENGREDESESEEYDNNPDGDSGVVDLTGEED